MNQLFNQGAVARLPVKFMFTNNWPDLSLTAERIARIAGIPLLQARQELKKARVNLQ